MYPLLLSHSPNHLGIVKANLANIHRRSFLQIGQWSVNNINTIHLLALDGISFNKLSTIFDNTFAYIINGFTLFKS
ncbi:hypothetical protein ES332_A10G153100v1 [Gossypium tomentosum]|nr:hypothetical protein ES332_A10G153100v1 [Gossypium tomentosum]